MYVANIFEQINFLKEKKNINPTKTAKPCISLFGNQPRYRIRKLSDTEKQRLRKHNAFKRANLKFIQCSTDDKISIRIRKEPCYIKIIQQFYNDAGRYIHS